MQNRLFLHTARFAAVAATLLGVGSARAQLAGTQTGQTPNVLLLVDTSGSMERMSNGTMPTCNPGTQTAPNRWGSLVQALTGSFQPFYSCATIPRTSPEFTAQYTGIWNANSPAGSNRPVDYGYVLPYNRPLTGSGTKLCGQFPNLITAGALTNSDRGDDLMGLVVNPATPRAYQNEQCIFDQADDGQLDAARPFVRFGLMTFDSDPSPALDAGGSWSYFRGNSAKGRLPMCPILDNEVGARSSSAPEWEGPLVPFPPADADLNTIAATNERIQRVLAALRPSGATPLDGLMADARSYLLEDPAGPSGNDPYFPGCRPQYVILLSDGAPNLDMRQECKGAGGTCPYTDTAKDVAFDLRSRGIPTFVIGFSVNGEVGAPAAFPDTSTSCTNWYEKTVSGIADPNARAAKFAQRCAEVNPAKESSARACCVLHEVSMNGNQEPALFAESQADLAEAFGTILGKITKSASTRTVPVYSTVTESSGNTSSFFAAFEPSATRPWSGDLDRQRLVCGASGIRAAVDIDPSQGDRLGDNLAEQNAANRRRFLFATPNATSGKSDPSISLRREDLTGTLTGIDTTFGARTFQEGFFNQSQLDQLSASSFLTPAMLAVTTADCRRSVDRENNVIPPLSVNDCARAVVGFATGTQTGLGMTGSVNGSNVSYDFAKLRCPPGAACDPLGAIFRAEPAYSGPPVEPLRDDSYQVFASQQAKRPPLLYVATTDGLLHAIKTDSVGAGERNTELWSYIPPAVLPLLRTNMPRGNQILLDGSPTVKDVVFSRTKAEVTFEQLSSAKTNWRTALVAGFGVGVRGYYAIDVTNPGPGNYNAANGTSDREWQKAYLDTSTGAPNGPHMLWQLTTVEEAAGATQSGNLVGTDAFGKRRYSLFGKRTAKPSITTLYFKPDGELEPREVAVAVLAGGIDEGSNQSGECPRSITAFNRPFADGAPKDMSPSSFGFRPQIRRWSASCDGPVAGRTMVVVRIDTGEVVRVFGRRADVPQVYLAGTGEKFVETPLDSPMSGVPVVYPGGLGTIGQKAIVGDADGTVWRFDLTSTDPSKWTGSLFFDTQGPGSAPPRAPATAATMGQPIVVTPVAAATDSGELMVGIATGEQESFVAPSGTDNFVYSLTETTRDCAIGSTVCAKLNWFQPLALGERVSGPMTIFDRTFYFATYAPAQASSSVCRNGLASLWGVDFVTPKTPGTLTTTLRDGGLPKLTGGANGALDPRQEAGVDLIPGVSIRQVPACSAVTLPEYGTGASAVFSPGSYQLVIPRASSATGAQGTVRGAQTNIQTRPIETLSTPTRLDSFAAIVE